MTGRAFEASYARIYDAAYVEKDYERECDLIEECFRRFARRSVRSVLDLGCGTGGHALPLAARGYDVAGVDLSEHMVAVAREKAAATDLAVELRRGDLRTVRLARRFDAVLMMFAVLGYQRTDDDVRSALATVREHLEPGGLLVLDCWHGPGVLADPPGERRKTIATAAGPVERRATAELDAKAHLCVVRYELEGALPGASRTAREEHVVRYFFPSELETFLSQANLELASLTPTGTLDRPADSSTWTALLVGRG
jgi:SAM-dependent methyltransferase